MAACEEIARYLHTGMLVILESTTYPGTTDEKLLPMLEKSGLKVGRDFFLCFSPERVDPGNQSFQTKNILKSRRRHHARMHRIRETVLFPGAGQRGWSEFDTGCRDG